MHPEFCLRKGHSDDRLRFVDACSVRSSHGFLSIMALPAGVGAPGLHARIPGPAARPGLLPADLRWQPSSQPCPECPRDPSRSGAVSLGIPLVQMDQPVDEARVHKVMPQEVFRVSKGNLFIERPQ
jgi:hypothetical protein